MLRPMVQRLATAFQRAAIPLQVRIAQALDYIPINGLTSPYVMSGGGESGADLSKANVL